MSWIYGIKTKQKDKRIRIEQKNNSKYDQAPEQSRLNKIKHTYIVI